MWLVLVSMQSESWAPLSPQRESRRAERAETGVARASLARLIVRFGDRFGIRGSQSTGS
jgi:hypothetical protein